MVESETNPRPEYWVLSLSGGKGFYGPWVGMADPAPSRSRYISLDEVIYCDVGMEFPAMVEHINRHEPIFTDAGIKFTRLKSESSFEWYMFDYSPNRRNPALQGVKGQIWPGPHTRWCTGQLKQKVISK